MEGALVLQVGRWEQRKERERERRKTKKTKKKRNENPLFVFYFFSFFSKIAAAPNRFLLPPPFPALRAAQTGFVFHVTPFPEKKQKKHRYPTPPLQTQKNETKKMSGGGLSLMLSSLARSRPSPCRLALSFALSCSLVHSLCKLTGERTKNCVFYNQKKGKRKK